LPNTSWIHLGLEYYWIIGANLAWEWLGYIFTKFGAISICMLLFYHQILSWNTLFHVIMSAEIKAGVYYYNIILSMAVRCLEFVQFKWIEG
jgi:hypothetical protein